MYVPFFRGMNMQSIKVHINAIIEQKQHLMDNKGKTIRYVQW